MAIRTIFGTTAFSLLFFANIKQGLHGVEVSHHEILNATVGQNISLPCVLKQQPSNMHVTQIEWGKKDAHKKHQPHKMVVYSAFVKETHLFWPNVSIQLVNDDQMPNVRLSGSILHLGAVQEQDSGVYQCDISTYPQGSIRRETKLKVKGVDIVCDRSRSFTANPGEDVTIRCSVDTASDARYNWTKDERPLSQNDSLQLWRVGDAEAGSYTLSVQTGNDLLYVVFNLTVLARNTHSETESTPSIVTEEYWNQTDQTVTPSESTHMTSPSTRHADASTWTIGVDTKMTAFKSDVTTSSVNHTISSGTVPSLTAEVNVSATYSSSPDRLTSTDLPAKTTSTEKLTARAVTNRPTILSDSESYPGNANEWTTLAYEEPGPSSTQEMSISDAEVMQAEVEPDKDMAAGDDTEVTTTVHEDTSSALDYLWLIIVIILALVVLVGFLYRKHTIRKKMDQPPPFKPPPPPTKYTSLLPQELPMTDVITTTV